MCTFKFVLFCGFRALTPQGLDNLLYSADADFSCFADLALTSPDDYYKEGEGSLLQSVESQLSLSSLQFHVAFFCHFPDVSSPLLTPT